MERQEKERRGEKKDKSKKGRMDGGGEGEGKRTEEVGQKRKGGKRNERRKIE